MKHTNRPSGRRRRCAETRRGSFAAPSYLNIRAQRLKGAKHQKREHHIVMLSFLVEARGVEPLSESTSTDLSPGADGYLDSLARA